MHRLSSFLLTVVSLLGVVAAQAPQTDPAETKAAEATYTHRAEYPLATCVVSGEPLEGPKVETFEAGGRTFKTCCSKCRGKVEKDPATYATKLDAALTEQQLARYPLGDCPVSGKPLGSMGDPYRLVVNETLVQLCCKGCDKRARAGADAIVTKIRDAAYEAQKATYPLNTCVVSGTELGAAPKEVMFGTRLVRFCSEKCITAYEADPAAYRGRLEPAATTDQEPQKEGGAPGCCETVSPGCCGSGAKPDAEKSSGGCCGEK